MRHFLRVDALERTRALIARELAVEIVDRHGDAYRDSAATMLEGDWLGAFAQPGVVLNTVSAMSVQLDGEQGRIVDEYGNSTVEIVRRDGDRVEFVKRYAETRFELVYIGRRSGGVLAGYWYASVRPAFAGVFWLARVDRLAESTATALRARVRSTSPRRTIVKGFTVATIAFGFGAVIGSAPLVLGAAATGVAFVWLESRRVAALRRDVDLWKQSL